MKDYDIIIGTKCATAPLGFGWQPETLGNIYRSVIEKHGECQLNKPVPGEEYRKMCKPIEQIDQPTFRKLPEQIIITQPARLFQSQGWKYHGRVYLDCELFWRFEYKYEYAGKWVFDWMPVRLLSWCYINETCTFTAKGSEPFWNNTESKQLTLFT